MPKHRVTLERGTFHSGYSLHLRRVGSRGDEVLAYFSRKQDAEAFRRKYNAGKVEGGLLLKRKHPAFRRK